MEETGFVDVAATSVNADASQSAQVVVQGRAQKTFAAATVALTDSQAQSSSAESGQESGQESSEENRLWLVFDTGHGLTEALAAFPGGPNRRCIEVRPGEHHGTRSRPFQLSPDSPEHMTRLLESVIADGTALGSVVYAWGLDAAHARSLSLATLHWQEARACYSLMYLMQSLTALELDHSLRLLVVTQGVQAVPDHERPVSVAQAPLIGLGRLIGNEHSNVRCQLVDLDCGVVREQAGAIFAELCQEAPEEEVALRDGARFVPRLDRLRSLSTRVDLTGDVRNDAPAFRLQPGNTGTLDALVLREVPRQSPGSGQVEIKVLAAALNFRDVLKALNLYPSDGGDYLFLGDECAGIVTATGAGVTDIHVGDEGDRRRPRVFRKLCAHARRGRHPQTPAPGFRGRP
ncbi:MAG: hypothetical protein R3F37_11085 [Candidatus Competibacteraceae bacterium]